MPDVRRLAALFVLSAVALGSTAAPAAAQRRIQPALVLGFSSSTIDSDDDAETSRRNGFALGALFVLPLGTNAGLETGLLYIQKGASADDPSLNFEASLDLAYLQVPLFLRYTFPGIGVRPYLGAGTALAYQFSCEFSADFDGLNVSADCEDLEDTDEPFAGGFEKLDMSLLIGGGIETNRLTFGVRYDHGLSNLVEDGSESAKNRTILVFAGVKLGR